MIATTPFTSCFLILTEDCNLRCKYCYENANRYNKNYMSFDTAKKSADFLLENVLEHNAETLTWTFFGGEPLLNLDVLIKMFHYALDKANQHNFKINFSIITNGTIYNKQFEEFILEWYKATKNVNIQVSTDGIPEIHDKNRVTIEGKPTSEIVSENILKIKKLFEQNHIESSCLRTHSVITKDNISKLFLNYKYFKQIGINKPQFMLSNEEAWNENDISIYTEQLSLITDYVYQECISSYSLEPHEEAKGLISIRFDEISTITCEAGKTLCAISPNGDIYPCDRTYFYNQSFRLGNVFDGIINNDIRKIFFDAYRSDMHAGNISCGKCDNTACNICILLNYKQNNDLLKCNSGLCSIYKAKWNFVTETKKKFDNLAGKLSYNKCNEMTFSKAEN